MQRAAKSALSLDVADTGELVVEGAELVPLGGPGHPDEGREVEARVVAHVLVVRLHGRVDEEVGDALVDRRAVLQRRDERPDVLERRPAHNLRARVQQETVVKPLQTLRVALHWRNLSYLSDDVSTRLSDFPFFILSQIIVKREQLS